MAIPAVSLKQNCYSNNGVSKKVSFGNKQIQQDEFTPSFRGKSSGSSKNKTLAWILSILGVATGGAIYGECTDKDIPKPVDIPTVAIHDEVSLEEIAERYNSTANIILDYNDADNIEEIKEKEEIKIPYSYDFIDKEIEELQEKLFSSKLDYEERLELEQKLSNLQAKKELQDSIAEVYSDGKYVYFNLIELKKDAPDSAKEVYENSTINVEKFKEIFDIKDGAIKKYNDISYHWDSDDEGYGGYKNYTSARLVAGDTIKVPLRSVTD